jgi:hypothetical protein
VHTIPNSIVGRIAANETTVADLVSATEELESSLTDIREDLDNKLESVTPDDIDGDIPMEKIAGLSEAISTINIKEYTPWKNGGDSYDNIVWNGTKWVWIETDGSETNFTAGDVDEFNSQSLSLNGIAYTRDPINGSAISENEVVSKLTSENSKNWYSGYPDSIVGRIKALEQNGGGGGSGTGDITTEEVKELDAQLHSVISEEITTKINEVKFSPSDSVEILSTIDVVNVLKNILIKLGMKEDAITINTSAFES